MTRLDDELAKLAGLPPLTDGTDDGQPFERRLNTRVLLALSVVCRASLDDGLDPGTLCEMLGSLEKVVIATTPSPRYEELKSGSEQG